MLTSSWGLALVAFVSQKCFTISLYTKAKKFQPLFLKKRDKNNQVEEEQRDPSSILINLLSKYTMGFRQTKSSQKRQHQQHHSTEISKCSKSQLTCLFIQTCQTLFTFLKKYSFRDYQNIFKGKEAVPYQKFDTSTSQLGFRCQYTWGMQFFLGYYLS